MRSMLGLIVAGLMVGSLSAAQAEEWCGFHHAANARFRCGFSSLAECKQAFGRKAKHVTCLPDPSFAQTQSGVGRG